MCKAPTEVSLKKWQNIVHTSFNCIRIRIPLFALWNFTFKKTNYYKKAIEYMRKFHVPLKALKNILKQFFFFVQHRLVNKIKFYI